MANSQPIPSQVADAPDVAFRGPFFEINPTAGPNDTAPPHHASHPEHAAAACPPAPATSSVQPVEIHEPAAGQRVEITVTPNQPLTFDFNPLDAQAVRHGDDLTLTFADGGVLVLHHIAQDGNPLPTPLQLPDGTIINPCELLQALPGEEANPSAGKIPNEKIPLINPSAGPEQINPAAGPTPIIAPGGAHPVVTAFDLPGIGNGLTPLGALPPEPFSTTPNFPPPGANGFPPTVVPPTPPIPPFTPPNTPPVVPPTSFIVAFEDSNSGVVPNLVDNPGQTTLTITGNFLTDFANSGGTHGVDGAPTLTFSNPVSVDTGTATGEFGTLSLSSNGTYTYTVDVAAETAANQLGSDRISEALNQQFSGAAPYLAPLEDEFVVTVSNGTTTKSELLALYVEGADVTRTTTAVAGTAAVPGTTLLLTYTDLYDPAHSFSELVTVNAGANTLVTDAPIQPDDPGLISLSLVSGASATITSIEVAGGTIAVPSETLDAAHHALTAIVDPQVVAGTTYAVLDAPTDWSNVTTSTAATVAGQYLYAEGNPVTLSVAPDSQADGTGVILNLGGAASGVEQGGLGSDTLVWNHGSTSTYYNGMAGAVVQGTATAGDKLSIDFLNSHLAGGQELVSITVTAGETTAQMAQALATAIDGDANLTALNGGHALADYGGGSSFQFSETPGSLAFGDTQYSEFATPSVFGTSPSENVSLSDGLDTLQLQSSGEAIDTTNPTTLAHLSNIEVLDLGSTAAGSGSNSLTLSPDSVFQLTHNETGTLTSFSGAGANGQPIQAIWVMGDASDTVNLTGFVSGSNPNPLISGPITSGAQDPIPNVLPGTAVGVPAGVDVNGTPESALITTGPTSPTQMVGFTEFSGVAANGNTVHVYVENAIAQAGHVHVT